MLIIDFGIALAPILKKTVYESMNLGCFYSIMIVLNIID